jgi:hypothetical protein
MLGPGGNDASVAVSIGHRTTDREPDIDDLAGAAGAAG